MASARLLSADLMSETLEPDGVSAILQTAVRSFVSATATDVGLWEAHPGTDVDVEADEVFAVLTGAGTVSFEDGSSIDLRPGVLVRLHEGDRTTWAVAERLRKLYIA